MYGNAAALAHIGCSGVTQFRDVVLAARGRRSPYASIHATRTSRDPPVICIGAKSSASMELLKVPASRRENWEAGERPALPPQR